MNKEALIAEIESWVNSSLPAPYRTFLLRYDETIFGDSVLIYPAEYLIERNETFETKVYCPGYIAIGDDSGGNAFVISLTEETTAVYTVGQGYMNPKGFELVANDLVEWISSDCPTPYA